MPRLGVLIAALLGFCSCQSTQSQDTVMGRDRVCRKHHIPLVVTRMFTTSGSELVHYRYDRCIECEEKWPNHIPTYFSLYRTELHRRPTTFPYCKLCEPEFRRCVGTTPCIMPPDHKTRPKT